MNGAFSHLSEPAPIDADFFTQIRSEKAGEKIFGDTVYKEFDYEAGLAGLDPEYSDDLLHDAYQSYLWDVKRLEKNMDSLPDHFKLCGYLAYWLRRNSPVVKWEELTESYALEEEQPKEVRELIFEFGRAYHAFSLGYRISLFFETHKESASPLPRPIDKEYIQTVCYFMKYKNVSPHAMGLVYHSLFFV